MTEAKTGVIQSWARACLKPSKPGRSWEGFFTGSLALWHPDILNWTVLRDSPVVSDRSQMWSCVSLSPRSKKKPVTFTLFSWTFRPGVQSNHLRSLLSQAAILRGSPGHMETLWVHTHTNNQVLRVKMLPGHSSPWLLSHIWCSHLPFWSPRDHESGGNCPAVILPNSYGKEFVRGHPRWFHY